MATERKRDYSIAIVGGGIGGLCAAIGLLQQGINVEIYEAAPAFSEIGAGLGLGPNALRSLKLLHPAAYHSFLKLRTTNTTPERQGTWLAFRIGDEPISEYASKSFLDQPCETGQSSVHRARFLDELVALIPKDKDIAHFGKKLVRFVDSVTSVTLHFTDGTQVKHSALVACDGIKSVARQQLLGPAYNPTFSGKYAYRGLIPMSAAATSLGSDLSQNSHMYLGHGGHVLTFPIEHGQTMNVVAFGTHEGPWQEKEWVKPSSRDKMKQDFEGWSEPVQKILALMPDKPDRWALFDHPPAPTYFKNRVCLLGDAAHATTPHNGAGAGMAIEDALILAAALGGVYKSSDVEKAFEVYDRIRRPRSQKLVRESRQMGRLYDLEVEDDVDKLREMLLHSREWLWGHDIGGDAKEAGRLMRQAVGA